MTRKSIFPKKKKTKSCMKAVTLLNFHTEAQKIEDDQDNFVDDVPDSLEEIELCNDKGEWKNAIQEVLDTLNGNNMRIFTELPKEKVMNNK